VIFMAALPMLQQQIDVTLPPRVRAPDPPPLSSIVLELSEARELSINQQPVASSALRDRLIEIYSTRRDKTLFLKGAPTLSYGYVIEIIDVARGAGVSRIGVITEGAVRDQAAMRCDEPVTGVRASRESVAHGYVPVNAMAASAPARCTRSFTMLHPRYAPDDRGLFAAPATPICWCFPLSLRPA
jgi:biopolymer transport protein ExbD